MTFPHGLQFTGKRPEDLYSKGIFTNSFPIALLNWMYTIGIKPRLVEGQLNELPRLHLSLMDAAEVFDGIDPSTLHYDFEKAMSAYSDLHSEDKYKKLTKVDVLASHPILGSEVKGLENKLTVVPDSSTHHLPEDQHAPEMVLRPASVATACSSLFIALSEQQRSALRGQVKVRNVNNIRNWSSESEVLSHYSQIELFVEDVLRGAHATQRPFLLQPIWATHGLTWVPRKHAYDLLVWTDHALLTLILLESKNQPDDETSTHRRGRKKAGKLGRSKRSVVRMARLFMELINNGEYNYNRVYKDISYDEQTDKEGSIPGKRIMAHLGAEPFVERRIPFTDVLSIIPAEGMELINPERRADLSIHMFWILHVKFGHSIEEIHERLGLEYR